MVKHATHPDRADTRAAIWLARLKEAHAALIGAIGELAQATSGPFPPGRRALVELRWAVSQASLDRRLLWGQIHTLLARRVEARLERDLRQLQEADVTLIRASAKHVSRWTIDAIMEDWEGYCQASELMRGQMLEAIGGEERLLYPILERLMADGSSNHCFK